jgi:hypothetical protein
LLKDGATDFAGRAGHQNSHDPSVNQLSNGVNQIDD